MFKNIRLKKLNDKDYEKILIHTYFKFLKREPDKEGFFHYMRQLKDGTISVNDLEKIFKDSNEFKSIKNIEIGKKINPPITKYFSSNEASKFLFFQFNSGNAKYFFKYNNSMSVQISDTPHYHLAKDTISGGDKTNNESKNMYIEYLKHSWPSYDLDTSQDKLNSKYQDYIEYIDKIVKSGKLNIPVILTQIPGLQGYYVVDGNHRCSIASALGLRIPAQILDFPSSFDQFMQIDEFYGTKNKNMPYQSIYINRNIVRNGRRNDIYDRLEHLPRKLLKQKTILDVACNLGMNSIASFQFGAKEVLGLEVSKRMVNFATRFAIFNGCYQNVQFKEFNIDEDHLPNDEKYDLAFMFSIHHHLKNPHSLANIVKQNINEAVIFEGHPGTTLNDYEEFLNHSQFSKIVKIADLDMSVFDKKPTRPLWIFYK